MFLNVSNSRAIDVFLISHHVTDFEYINFINIFLLKLILRDEFLLGVSFFCLGVANQKKIKI